MTCDSTSTEVQLKKKFWASYFQQHLSKCGICHYNEWPKVIHVTVNVLHSLTQNASLLHLISTFYWNISCRLCPLLLISMAIFHILFWILSWNEQAPFLFPFKVFLVTSSCAWRKIWSHPVVCPWYGLHLLWGRSFFVRLEAVRWTNKLSYNWVILHAKWLTPDKMGH